jgi:hypothetical protein
MNEIKKQRVRASLKREKLETVQVQEPVKTERPRCVDRTVRQMQPMVFHTDASDLDVASVHVFTSPDSNDIALGFITRQGTINLTVPPGLARQLSDGLHRLVPRQRPVRDRLRQQDDRR